MTIIEVLQEVNNSMSRPLTFIYADLNEANLEADKLLNSELPINIIMPFSVTDVPGTSGILKSTFELNAFFLNKSSNITTDFKAIEIETEVIAPMRALAREFIFRLNEHSIVDPETKGLTSIVYQPVYSSMDANLFGVWAKATVPVMEGLSGCNH